MKKLGAIALSMFALGITGVATAADDHDAQLTRIEGNVLINQGENYQTAREGMLLREGDRLMVMEGAKMAITYQDGCFSSFEQGQIIEISKVSTCEGGQAFVKTAEPMHVDAAPGAGAGAKTGVLGNMTVMEATTFVGAAAAGGAANESGSDPDPISP